MTFGGPRLRRDLISTILHEDGVRCVDVYDPRRGSSFRLFDYEYSVALAFDGRPLAKVISWVRLSTGLELTEEQLTGFARRLEQLGFLEGDRASGVAPEVPPPPASVAAPRETASPAPSPPVLASSDAAAAALARTPSPEAGREESALEARLSEREAPAAEPRRSEPAVEQTQPAASPPDHAPDMEPASRVETPPQAEPGVEVVAEASAPVKAQFPAPMADTPVEELTFALDESAPHLGEPLLAGLEASPSPDQETAPLTMAAEAAPLPIEAAAPVKSPPWAVPEPPAVLETPAPPVEESAQVAESPPSPEQETTPPAMPAEAVPLPIEDPMPGAVESPAWAVPAPPAALEEPASPVEGSAPAVQAPLLPVQEAAPSPVPVEVPPAIEDPMPAAAESARSSIEAPMPAAAESAPSTIQDPLPAVDYPPSTTEEPMPAVQSPPSAVHEAVPSAPSASPKDTTPPPRPQSMPRARAGEPAKPRSPSPWMARMLTPGPHRVLTPPPVPTPPPYVTPAPVASARARSGSWILYAFLGTLTALAVGVLIVPLAFRPRSPAPVLVRVFEARPTEVLRWYDVSASVEALPGSRATGWRATFELPRAQVSRFRKQGFCQAEVEGRLVPCQPVLDGGDETHALIELPLEAASTPGQPVRLARSRLVGVFVVPASAVSHVGDSERVFVVSPTGRAVARSVVVVDRTPSDAIITQGLDAGEAVVVESSQPIGAGTRVQVMQTPRE